MRDSIGIAASLICRDDFEGFKAASYLCPADYWTIGYGNRFIAPNRPVTPQTRPLTRAAALDLLRRTLVQLRADLVSCVHVSLAPQQEGALLSWQFNIGNTAMRNSTLIRVLNLGQLEAAGRELLRWDKATVRGKLITLPGLKKRRQIEYAVFNGQSPPDQPDLFTCNQSARLTSATPSCDRIGTAV